MIFIVTFVDAVLVKHVTFVLATSLIYFTRWTTKIRGKLLRGRGMKNVAGLHGQVCSRPQHDTTSSSPQAACSIRLFFDKSWGDWGEMGTKRGVSQHSNSQETTHPSLTTPMLFCYCVFFAWGFNRVMLN